MTQESKVKQPEEPPPRRNWPDSVARDANSLGRAALAKAGFREPTLVLRWEEIAGPEVALLAQPIRLSEGPSGGVLTLKAEPSAALFLQHESRTICERVNGFLGFPAVAKLRFVQGPITRRRVRQPKPRRPGNVAPTDPVLKCRTPESLRAALLRLAQARRRED
jgi:hypothetical protein